MIVAIDVLYRESGAHVGALAFEDWGDAEASFEWVTDIDDVAQYEPGEFYVRELPCLLEALAKGAGVLGDREVTAVIVDGYVWLNLARRKGLGAHLYSELGEATPVIGVAKNPFRDNDACVEVLRGGSRRPLYVTSAGFAVDDAARCIEGMHGDHRVPTLLRRVDELSRG